MAITAAQMAITASGEQLGTSHVARLVRRFSETLSACRVTFHEFLIDEEKRSRVLARDTGLRCLLGYLDPTGVKATTHAMRQWCDKCRTYHGRHT